MKLRLYAFVLAAAMFAVIVVVLLWRGLGNTPGERAPSLIGVSFDHPSEIDPGLLDRVREGCAAVPVQGVALVQFELWLVDARSEEKCRAQLAHLRGIEIVPDNLRRLYADWRDVEVPRSEGGTKQQKVRWGHVSLPSAAVRFASLTGRSLAAAWEQRATVTALQSLPDSTMLELVLPGGTTYPVIVDRIQLLSSESFSVAFHGARPYESGTVIVSQGRYGGSWRVGLTGFSLYQLTDGTYVVKSITSPAGSAAPAGTRLSPPSPESSDQRNAKAASSAVTTTSAGAGASIDSWSRCTMTQDGVKGGTATHVVKILVGYTVDVDDSSIDQKLESSLSWDGSVEVLNAQSSADLGPSVHQGVNVRVCYIPHARPVEIHLSALRRAYNASDPRASSELLEERNAASSGFAERLLNDPTFGGTPLRDFFGPIRSAAGADFALLLVGGESLGNLDGFAAAIGADDTHAAALVQLGKEHEGFGALHEVGHLLGARHERSRMEILRCLNAPASSALLREDECVLDRAEEKHSGRDYALQRPNRAYVSASFSTIMASLSLHRTAFWSSQSRQDNLVRTLSSDGEDNRAVIEGRAAQIKPEKPSQPIQDPVHPDAPGSAKGPTLVEKCEATHSCAPSRPRDLGQFFYFPSDVWDLEGGSAADVKQEVQTFGTWLATENVKVVYLDGYADTVDTEQYNQHLSELRAASVATVLREQNPGLLTLCKGNGYHSADRPTAMNVSEPRNRRVVVRWDELCTASGRILCREQFVTCPGVSLEKR